MMRQYCIIAIFRHKPFFRCIYHHEVVSLRLTTFGAKRQAWLMALNTNALRSCASHPVVKHLHAAIIHALKLRLVPIFPIGW